MALSEADASLKNRFDDQSQVLDRIAGTHDRVKNKLVHADRKDKSKQQ